MSFLLDFNVLQNECMYGVNKVIAVSFLLVVELHILQNINTFKINYYTIRPCALP